MSDLLHRIYMKQNNQIWSKILETMAVQNSIHPYVESHLHQQIYVSVHDPVWRNIVNIKRHLI